jgi:phage pi2 protein 07
MIESHYSLNVSTQVENGRWTHYCRIHLGTWEAEAKEKARTIAHNFGDKYQCDLTFVECIGYKKEF